MKLQLYHGTSEEKGKKIEAEGFVPDKSYNWDVHSKKGFVYLSDAYAPFYAMSAAEKGEGTRLALVKVEVDTADLYPEDDFIMYGMGKPKYTQAELDKIDLEEFKPLWRKSLEYMGNVAVKPDKVKILGVRYFEGKHLLMKCDPVISPLNYHIMGDYYKDLSNWLYEGKPVEEFRNLISDDILKQLKEVKDKKVKA